MRFVHGRKGMSAQVVKFRFLPPRGDDRGGISVPRSSSLKPSS